RKLEGAKKDNALPVLNIAERTDDLPLIEETAKRITGEFRRLVVVGMGGSSYGGKAICSLAHNMFARDAGVTVHFLDNVDPFTSNWLLLSLDFKSTLFLLVSKSGDTAETLAQALILI